MKTRLFAAFLLGLVSLACASPIRVPYLGKPDRAHRMTAQFVKRDLGRDSIRFDWVSRPTDATCARALAPRPRRP